MNRHVYGDKGAAAATVPRHTHRCTDRVAMQRQSALIILAVGLSASYTQVLQV